MAPLSHPPAAGPYLIDWNVSYTDRWSAQHDHGKPARPWNRMASLSDQRRRSS